MMFTVFVVDDDPSIIKALSRLLRVNGYDVRPFTSPHEFLDDHDASVPGCALLDVYLPGLDGLELQQHLMGRGSNRPIIFMTAKGDIPMSVRAMRAGAVDFLTKPVSNKDLLAAIARAEEQDARTRRSRAELASIEAKIASLTPREREVLSHVVDGRLSKQIAFDLGTTEKTIKFHRSSIMRKLGVRMVADLVRMVERTRVSEQETMPRH
jgi:FixJ family two-component response regulator